MKITKPKNQTCINSFDKELPFALKIALKKSAKRKKDSARENIFYK